MADTGRELGWNDPIEKDSEFQLLPAGDCRFEVISFERGRHAGSTKLPPCNKAILKIVVTNSEGNSTTIEHNLFLHTTTEGLITAFFTAIGQRKKGERITPDWSKVVGSTGTCKIYVDKWEKDGREGESNKIQKFYEKEAATFTPGTF